MRNRQVEIHTLPSNPFLSPAVIAALISLLSLRPPASKNSSKHLNKIYSHQEHLVRRAVPRNEEKLSGELRWKERKLFYSLFFCSLSPNTCLTCRRILPVASLVMGGGRVVLIPFILMPFFFVCPINSRFLSLCSWDRRRTLEKVHRVSFACWGSHYEVLSTTPLHINYSETLK